MTIRPSRAHGLPGGSRRRRGGATWIFPNVNSHRRSRGELTEYPRGGRGVAATRIHGISTRPARPGSRGYPLPPERRPDLSTAGADAAHVATVFPSDSLSNCCSKSGSHKRADQIDDDAVSPHGDADDGYPDGDAHGDADDGYSDRDADGDADDGYSDGHAYGHTDDGHPYARAHERADGVGGAEPRRKRVAAPSRPATIPAAAAIPSKRCRRVVAAIPSRTIRAADVPRFFRNIVAATAAAIPSRTIRGYRRVVAGITDYPRGCRPAILSDYPCGCRRRDSLADYSRG